MTSGGTILKKTLLHIGRLGIAVIKYFARDMNLSKITRSRHYLLFSAHLQRLPSFATNLFVDIFRTTKYLFSFSETISAPPKPRFASCLIRCFDGRFQNCFYSRSFINHIRVTAANTEHGSAGNNKNSGRQPRTIKHVR